MVDAGHGVCRPTLHGLRHGSSSTWGELWHLDGIRRERRNAILRTRDVYDYSFMDWIYGPTALAPEQEPEMFRPIALECGEAPDGMREAAHLKAR